MGILNLNKKKNVDFNIYDSNAENTVHSSVITLFICKISYMCILIIIVMFYTNALEF